MKLVAISPVRNESWVIPYSARAALTWVDEIVFLDHASTDATPQILSEIAAEHPGRVTILRQDDPTWDEMNHRQTLLEAARERGASHIAILDADEILAANLRVEVSRMTAFLAPGHILHVPLHNLWRSLEVYRNDGYSLYGCSWAALTFRDAPELCWQPAEDGYQHHSRTPENAEEGLRVPKTGGLEHHLRNATGDPTTLMRAYLAVRDGGGLMHLQHASWGRLRAKQALYQLIEAIRWPHRDREAIRELYSASLDEKGAVLKPVPSSWWEYDIPRELIDADAEPWQEGECRRLLTKYGRKAFDGLDLFGVDI